MRAHFARFLKHVNIFGGKRGRFARGFVLFDKIRKVQRAGEPGGPRAHNQHIRFENFVFHAHRAILAEAQQVSIASG